MSEQPFKVEVQENGSTEWISNQLRYATIDEADRYGYDLMSRWFGIEDYRVVDTRTEEIIRYTLRHPAYQP